MNKHPFLKDTNGDLSDEAADAMLAGAVMKMVDVVEQEDPTVAGLAEKLIATMGDRDIELKLVMMAVSYAAALKIIAKRNTPTEGDK